ncbi:drug resistance transporter, EmrB/QacA subfamily [Streptomyces sp. DvalAA-14]|uniref:MFS transporter n=1 Tax=unclassified Streptomyces TaxID=2593676 RepID=UPI00081AFFCA|nr:MULTISPECIES: MFS transporter [unclassified Streptomyces]MYS19788.1 DHA2 family efflux MFS transporter permease subunit [Streptomyces sp. SID4948]SCD53355.1 drug resistance transporter, EmrB/QacA subfamily [Streptomyces sp. DvalAA-14]
MPELTYRRRMLILAICCMSLLIVSLDNTILNVALPSMQKDFHASVSGLQWTIDAYLLVLASLLLLSGSTADRVGRRRIFQIGLALFTAGSMLCSLAPSLGWLIVFRMVQAVGGSMLNPVAMSIITNTFSEPRERARAIGVWGGVVGISMAAGPIVGGALVQSAGWRSIFWINVPVGVAALVLTARFVPESRAQRARRVDPVGQLLVIALLGTLTYGIIEGTSAGWGSPLIVGCFLVAALSVAGLAAYEKRRVDPLIDTRFFRSVPFSGATVIAVSAFAALGGFLFLNTLYLQEQRGMSALDAGLHMLPMAVMTLIFAPLSGRLVGTRGPRIPLLLAGTAMTISGVLFAGFHAQSSDTRLYIAYVVFGIGFGFVNAPITNTAVSGMPRAQAGVAAAVASTSRQIGQSLGVAVLGAALAAGLHAGTWWIITGCGASVLVFGVLTTGRWARGTADRTAGLLTPEVEDASRITVGAS